MPATSTTAAVREALAGDVNVPADDVIRIVRDAGVSATDASIRDAVYNVKSELRKAAKKGGTKLAKPAKGAPKPVPAAARATKEPEAATESDVAAAAPAPVVAAPPADLRAVLANVALVNGVLAACGGAEAVRKVAEAVQACGGVEPFLLHLELVAQVRGATA